jgi:hypothetical protein
LSMQQVIPILKCKLHMLQVLAQFKYNFTILSLTFNRKVYFGMDFLFTAYGDAFVKIL